jgi:hypothetical protein
MTYILSVLTEQYNVVNDELAGSICFIDSHLRSVPLQWHKKYETSSDSLHAPSHNVDS